MDPLEDAFIAARDCIGARPFIPRTATDARPLDNGKRNNGYFRGINVDIHTPSQLGHPPTAAQFLSCTVKLLIGDGLINVTDDIFISQLGGASISNNGFVTAGTGLNIASAGTVVEVDASDFNIGTLTNVSAIEAYLDTLTMTTTVAGPSNLTFVVYSSTFGTANAGVYQAVMTNVGDVTSIELIGQINAVGADNLSGINFA